MLCLDNSDLDVGLGCNRFQKEYLLYFGPLSMPIPYLSYGRPNVQMSLCELTSLSLTLVTSLMYKYAYTPACVNFNVVLLVWVCRNVPYDWITDIKANQRWMQKEGEKFLFPGGGTMFPKGVGEYLDHMEELIPGMKLFELHLTQAVG